MIVLTIARIEGFVKWSAARCPHGHVVIDLLLLHQPSAFRVTASLLYLLWGLTNGRYCTKVIPESGVTFTAERSAYRIIPIRLQEVVPQIAPVSGGWLGPKAGHVEQRILQRVAGKGLLG